MSDPIAEPWQQRIAELRRLEAEIEAALTNAEDPLEDTNDTVLLHQKGLQRLFADLGDTPPSDALRAELKITQERLSDWTTRAEAEREATRGRLLNLAQGRKAKKQY